MVSLAFQAKNSSLNPPSPNIHVSNSSNIVTEVLILIPSLFHVSSYMEITSHIATPVHTLLSSLLGINTELSLRISVIVKPKRKYQRKQGLRNKQIFEVDSNHSVSKERKIQANTEKKNKKVFLDEASNVLP